MKTSNSDPNEPTGWMSRLYAERRRFATVAAAILAIAIGYTVIFGENGLTAYRQKREDAQTLERQAEQMQRENEALKCHVDRLASDPAAIEHQARVDMHYTRPNEIIVTLPAEPVSTKPVSIK